MKTKIFNALKQEYARLGLGDNILSGLSDMLASTGMVTEENLQSVVVGQKAYLEDLQKSNDRRVQEAVTKTQNEATSKADAAKAEHAAAIAKIQKELDEYKAAHPAENVEDKNMPDWYKAEKAEREKRMKEMQDALDAIKTAKEESDNKLKAIEEQRTAEENARAAAERAAKVEAKAKEKGIPDWMIKHGFADIPADADDATIESILAGYANEIQTNFLPNRGGIPQGNNKVADKKATDSIALKMLPGFANKENK